MNPAIIIQDAGITKKAPIMIATNMTTGIIAIRVSCLNDMCLLERLEDKGRGNIRGPYSITGAAPRPRTLPGKKNTA